MNKSIEKAINLTQRLRSVMLQMVALEKEYDEWESSDEYVQSLVSDFNEDWNKSDDLAAAWGKMSDKERRDYFKKVEKLNKKSRSKRNGKKPATRSARSLKEQDAAEESTAILAQIDQLLYSLMNLGGEEGWNDEADYEERTPVYSQKASHSFSSLFSLIYISYSSFCVGLVSASLGGGDEFALAVHGCH